MTKDEIKNMWLLAARLRSLPESDPRLEPALRELVALKDRYVAEVMNPVNSGEPPPAREVWQEALGYIAQLFEFMDKNDPAGAGLRRGIWETVSGTLSTFWQSPLCEEARKTLLPPKDPDGGV